MKNTLMTSALIAGTLGLMISANAAIVQGDFSSGESSVNTDDNNILRYDRIDAGWDTDFTGGWQGNAGGYAETLTGSASLGQAFTNTQTGSGTIAFDWDALDGTLDQLEITYTVYGWGEPTSAPSGATARLFRLNGTIESYGLPGAPAAVLVSGVVSDVSGGGATTFTSASFDLSAYATIGVHFLQTDSTLASRTLDNVVLSHTVAVPGPSSAALLGLGGIALILRRRK